MTASRYTRTSHILVRSLSVCGCCCLNDDVPLLHRRQSRSGSLGFHVVTKFPCFTSTSSDCTHFKLVLVPRQTNKKHILVSRRRICKSPKCEEYGVPRCDCQCVRGRRVWKSWEEGTNSIPVQHLRKSLRSCSAAISVSQPQKKPPCCCTHYLTSTISTTRDSPTQDYPSSKHSASWQFYFSSALI